MLDEILKFGHLIGLLLIGAGLIGVFLSGRGRPRHSGWQHHTIRGAISGALKKKLGLTIVATRTREVGRNKTGAKDSRTVYRITASLAEAN